LAESFSGKKLVWMITTFDMVDNDLSSPSNLTSTTASIASNSPASLDALYDCYLNMLTNGLSMSRFDQPLPQFYTTYPELLSPNNGVILLDSSKGIFFVECREPSKKTGFFTWVCGKN
jgi:hypothetical protein